MHALLPTRPLLARTASLGALRLIAAAIALTAVAYVLSWQILFNGLPHGDTLFHLHLTNFAASTFPGLPTWWYPWDGNGLPYREGYPLTAHWLAVAAARMSGTNPAGGIQIVDFLVSPICAIGVYAFCDWRLKRPLAGIIAGVLYLLSPMSWFGLYSLGVYTDQVSTTLFMPAMIALDMVATAWVAGRRGWDFRLAVVAFAILSSGVGLVGPAQWPGAVGAVLFYALMVPAGLRKRWLLVVTPALWVAAISLAAFWLLPIRDYLGFTAARTPALIFNSANLSLLHLDVVLQLHPLAPDSGDRFSLSPAATIPALFGVIAAIWERRARVFVALLALALVFGTQQWALAPLGAVPFAQQFTGVVHRPAVLYLQFLVPILAGLGLVVVPQVVFARVLDVLGMRQRVLVPVVIGITSRGSAFAAATALIIGFAGYVDRNPGHLSYGPEQARIGDIWQRSPCDPGPACSFRDSPLADQLLSLDQWRSPQVGCFFTKCAEFDRTQAALAAMFSQAPQRSGVNSDNYLLGMAFHEISGGASDYTYAGQLVTSEALNSWVVDNTLHQRGTVAKAQLAQVLGLDSVVLAGPSQLGQGADYQALGWQRTAGSVAVDVYTNPSPTGLAVQWPSGTNVLVVGASQASAADVYNNMFKYATGGLIPYSQGWLVRSRSSYVDDYSYQELSRYRALVLLGYRYHDHDAAWNLIDQYARSGGAVFLETGWQFVDPDWNASTVPAALPVSNLHWGALDPRAAVAVYGNPDPGWGSMAYQSAGWGASSASSVRPGAQALVSVGDRVVVASWPRGKGQVVWSGMNLLAHDAGAHSTSEDAFITGLFSSLLPSGNNQIDAVPEWHGNDEADIPLAVSSDPSLVLFKQSMFPGWSARLVTGSGSQPLPIEPSEMDFMLVRLDSVPAGSRLVFTYSPTLRLEAWWAVSILDVIVLLFWLFKPDMALRPLIWISSVWSGRRYLRWSHDEE